MNRRDFLVDTGMLTTGLFVTDAVIRKNVYPDRIAVNVYQTHDVTEKFQKYINNPQFGLDRTAHLVRTIFAPTFRDIEFSVVRGETTVNAAEIRGPGQTGRNDMRKTLQQWINYETQTPKSCHVNLLIDARFDEYKDLNYSGVSTHRLLPFKLSCSSKKGHAVVHIHFGESRISDLITWMNRLISHEIGHSLGLKHHHGCNIDNKKSIMLADRFAERIPRNVYAQPIQDYTSSILQFNPKLDEKNIRL